MFPQFNCTVLERSCTEVTSYGSSTSRAFAPDPVAAVGLFFDLLRSDGEVSYCIATSYMSMMFRDDGPMLRFSRLK